MAAKKASLEWRTAWISNPGACREWLGLVAQYNGSHRLAVAEAMMRCAECGSEDVSDHAVLSLLLLGQEHDRTPVTGTLGRESRWACACADASGPG